MRGEYFAAIIAACLVVLPAQASGPDPVAYARQLVKAADPGARPFAIVDKLGARILVFRADGRLAGASPVLIGTTPGDQTVAGVGKRTQAGGLRAGDETTPAGRFISEPGVNRHGEHIVWLDYEAAFAIHRLRPGPTMRERERRLASPTVSDNRVSAGCVVVPPEFYVNVIQPLLGKARGVVYVLPEMAPDSAL
jgi:hypothetical protein